MDVMTSVTSCQAFFFLGGGGGKRRGGGRVTPSKEKEKKDRLIAGYDLSCKPANSEELLGCFFRVNENKLTKTTFSKLFAKEITKNAIR